MGPAVMILPKTTHRSWLFLLVSLLHIGPRAALERRRETRIKHMSPNDSILYQTRALNSLSLSRLATRRSRIQGQLKGILLSLGPRIWPWWRCPEMRGRKTRRG